MVCLLLVRNHYHLLGLSFLLGGFWEKMSVIGVYFDPSVVVVCGKRKLRSWFWRVRAGIRRQIRSSRSKQRFSFNYDPFSYALNFDNGNFGFFCQSLVSVTSCSQKNKQWVAALVIVEKMKKKKLNHLFPLSVCVSFFFGLLFLTTLRLNSVCNH